MIPSVALALSLIESAQRDGMPLIIYKIKGDESIRLWALSDDSDASTEDHLIISSFDGGEVAKLAVEREVVVRGADFLAEMSGRVEALPIVQAETEAEIRARFASRFESITRLMQEKNANKCVISNYKIDKSDYSPISAYISALRAETGQMTYMLCYRGETWVGSTPELLLSRRDGLYRTMALAGTMPAESHTQWSDKNRDEQMVVADYLANIISSIGVIESKVGPIEKHAGAIKHLCTEFAFRSTESDAVILSTLHPTPAISGFPSDVAEGIIRQSEQVGRGLYAGYISICRGEEVDAYVNLRCAKCEGNVWTTYAGCGVMPSSTESEEFAEWQLKVYSIQRTLGLI